jgi:hypothetical protein
MLRRPMRRMGRPGLLGTAARTAVVAGTATAVVGGMHMRQQARAQQAADAQAYQDQQNTAATQIAEEPMPPPPDAGGADDMLAPLERPADLKRHGILTEAEFAAQKATILGP